MELEEAINLIKKAVKYAGNVDQKHIDLTIVPTEERSEYVKALAVADKFIKEGKITRDKFLKSVDLLQ